MAKKREKPTKEQIEQFKKEFEEANKAFIETTYPVGDHENAIKYIDNILKWVERWQWQDNQWQGVIKLHEELNMEKERIAKDENAVLTITSGAVSFILYILDHQNGRGLETAKVVEKELPEMIEVYDKVKEQAQIAASLIQKASNAQKTWQIAEQGFWSKVNENGEVVPDITEEELKELQEQQMKEHEKNAKQA